MITKEEIEKVAKGMIGSIRSPHEQDLFTMGAEWAISKQQAEIDKLKDQVAVLCYRPPSELMKEIEELRQKLKLADKVLQETQNYLCWREDDLIGDDLKGDGRLSARFLAIISTITETLEQLNKPTEGGGE
jgi:hypothetical protein